MIVDKHIDDVFNAKPVSSTSGIDCYVQNDYFWRELGRQETITLTELARKIGWRKAVLTLQNKNVIRYITDPTRLQFLDFLAIKKGARVLDLGAGWGSLSIQIAKRFPSTVVYAFDMTLEGLVFLDIVKKQQDLSNLRIAKVGADKIPLTDSSMDVVLMIGVLEWVGESITSLGPGAAQMAVLAEVGRTLRKGGKLVIGIENRYSYKYLRGKPEHSRIRFGSVLPRKLVSLYSRSVKKREYRTYIYSLGEYAEILGQAGYKDLHFYGAYPDYRFPRVISDLGSMHEFWRDAHAPGSRLLKHLPNGLLKRIVPSYFIIAQK
ncbi:MAG TPA: methyltransferase domain-containing protein [Nitrososphaerales archaeon]|nr:methyltransferase domain-containing protein [Nitrososphaerales archaeon]